MTIPVLTLPGFDPGGQRIRVDMPEGLTVAQIVDRALDTPCGALRERVRVVMISNTAEWVVPDDIEWSRVRPKAGVTVLVRVMPAGDDLNAVLAIAVTIGAYAAGQFWAGPALAGLFPGISAATLGSVASAGLAIAGLTLVNWLVPPTQQREKKSYELSAWRNEIRPNDPVPVVYGDIRYAPPMAVRPYIEIVGDEMFIRGAFLLGMGPIAYDEPRLGDTLLSDFDEVQSEVRLGLPDDEPLTLITQQVMEESVGTLLEHTYPRDDEGEPITTEPPVDSPVVRLTAADVSEASLIMHFPKGLWSPPGFLSSRPKNQTVKVRLRYRLAGDLAWYATETLAFTARITEGFFRQHRIAFPSRGRWEIEMTRTSKELVNVGDGADDVLWYILQSVRPEYPLNFEHPIGLFALRIRATHQLNGALDNFNLILKRVASNWNGSAWVDAETRNPAAAYRHALTSAANAYPTTSMVDGEIEAWHAFCEAKGLHYDRVHDFSGPLQDVLADIARAGRASPRRDGNAWGVVIDRPRDMVVAHINERNARDLTWSRSFARRPDGVRVSFQDRDNSYQTRERIIPWPGHTGPVLDAEELPMPGKTDAAEVYREAYRHMLAVEHRRDIYSAVQDGAVRTATRGDLVKANFESLVSTQATLRVTSMIGNTAVLDGVVSMEAGKTYALRFIAYERNGAGEIIGFESVLRLVTTNAGEHGALTFKGSGDLPEPGTFAQFGPSGAESIDLIVAAVEAGEDMTTVIHAVDAAPEIDELTDALVIPDWDGRVGEILAPDMSVPALPKIVSLSSHRDDDGVVDGALVVLSPDPAGTVSIGDYDVRHRADGASTWLGPASAPAGAGGVPVTVYAEGAAIEMQYRSVSTGGVPSPWSATLDYTIPAAMDIPSAPPSATVSARLQNLGKAAFALQAPPESTHAALRLYVSSSNDFATAALKAEQACLPNATISITLGDATRINLWPQQGFDASTGVTVGANWAVATSKATHTAGSTAALTAALAATSGQVYRYALTLSGVSAGSVVARLTGGATVSSASLDSNGDKSGEMIASASHTTFGLAPTSAFVGSGDDLVVYLRTASCLVQGTYYAWATSINEEEGESSPTAVGAFTVI